MPPRRVADFDESALVVHIERAHKTKHLNAVSGQKVNVAIVLAVGAE